MSRKFSLAVAVIALLLLVSCGGATATPTTAPEVDETDEAATTEEPEEEATDAATEAPTEEAAAPNVPMSEIAPQHIFTTGLNVVGIGSYVAAEPYGTPAGEDPAAVPVQAFILPYAIYPNMLIEDIADFEQPAPLSEDVTFAWTLEVPEGSSAELLADNPVAIFQADVEGEYLLTLTVTDAAEQTATAEWPIVVSTYVGVGGEDADAPQCIACHDEQVEAWAATNHATMFTRSIDGETSDHYNANCITCHTTGFNNLPGAENGGFDDLAVAAGWEFPGTLQEGNWDAMVEQYPEVAAMANIQCESCHGPGADHNGDEDAIGRGLSYATCAQCHGEDPYHVFPQQWEVSPHAQKLDRSFWYPTGENRVACVKCHTGGGYIDAANGVEPEEMRNTYQVITCAVCHDPHDAENPNQLRVFDTVELPNGVAVEDAGPAATCMSCHNTRTNPVASVEEQGAYEIMQGETATGKFRIAQPHYSAAAELLTGGNAGYTWGEELPSTPHGEVVENSCIGCHMAGTPEEGQPGNNTVGQHTFLTTSPDGVQNVAVCQQCHTDATSFDFEASGDYDGDGAVENNHEELEGLLEVLHAQLEAKGVVFLESNPYYNVPQGSDTNLVGALYNYHLVLETVHRGAEEHNVKYLVALMHLSYEKLTGTPVPNATPVED